MRDPKAHPHCQFATAQDATQQTTTLACAGVAVLDGAAVRTAHPRVRAHIRAHRSDRPRLKGRHKCARAGPGVEQPALQDPQAAAQPAAAGGAGWEAGRGGAAGVWGVQWWRGGACRPACVSRLGLVGSELYACTYSASSKRMPAVLSGDGSGHR